MTERQNDPQAWIAKAEEDFAAADVLLRAGGTVLGLAGYHAQQAAEKYLKAVLVCAGHEPPRIHDLAELLALVQDACGPDVGPFAENAGWLTAFAAGSRYPDLPAPECTRADAQRALAVANRIKDFCRDCLAACSG